MYTQCPECHIAFRVTVQVLQQAGGRVQCGGCNNPFNAVDYLSDEPPTSDAEHDIDSVNSPIPSEALADEGDGVTDEAGEDDSAPSFEERNTQLLKALDELAGPEEELRIEDTGIEWRVLGKGQGLADGAEEETKAPQEQRYDDSTPLPEGFGEEDHDDSPSASALWSPSADGSSEEPEKLPLLEDAQVDLTLEDPDEWLDLLDDALDEKARVPDDDMATASQQRDLLNDTSNAALRMEAEEELAAIHNELSSTLEPLAATAENENTLSEEEAGSGDVELLSAERESIATQDDIVTGEENGADDEQELVNPEEEQPEDDSEATDLEEDAPDDDADTIDPEEDALDADVDAVDAEEDELEADADTVDPEEDVLDDDVDAIDPQEDSLDDDVDAIDPEEDALEADVDAADAEEDELEEDEDAADVEEEALEEDPAEDEYGVDDHDRDEQSSEDRDEAQRSEDEPADDQQDTENSEGEDEEIPADDFRSQIALIEDSLADELLADDESAQDNDGDEIVIEETEVEEHEIEKELLSPFEQDSRNDELAPESPDHTMNSKIHDDMRRAMEDEQFAATMVGEDGSPMIETIIMEGDFVRGSIEPAQDDAETVLPGDLEEPKSLIDTYVLSRRSATGSRFFGMPGQGAAAGIVVLLLVLVGQYIHSSREYLATHGMFNQTIGPVYRALGRPVRPAWDIKGWQFETTNGSTDEGEQLLTIYSSVSNRSSQALPYPLVYVSLTDRWEEIVGSRVLEPDEYLAGNPDPSKPVAPGNKFTAVISIAAPPAEVTGFKLNVCYRVGPEQLSCAIEDFK